MCLAAEVSADSGLQAASTDIRRLRMDNTGREVLRKDVKVRGWILFGIFSVILVFMIITICSMIHNGDFELNSFTGPLIFLTVISVICIWDGIRMIRTPEKLLNRENRNHGGGVYEMADKLYGDIIYEDKYIMVSHEVIASKKVRYNLAYRWDVYLITYVYRSMRYGKLEYYCMHTGNPENDVHIYLNGYKTGKGRKRILDTILSYCPNAIYGDLDGAGGEYLKKMRKTDIHDIPHSPYYTGNNTQ